LRPATSQRCALGHLASLHECQSSVRSDAAGLRAQSKLLNTQVVCPASGSCDTVLTSGYADVFGVPLSLFGTPPVARSV